jgi:hypothetical protein
LRHGTWDAWDGRDHVDQRNPWPNEVVFDYDGGDQEERREQTRKIIEYLNDHDIPFYVTDTGGTGYHVHVFFTIPDVDDWREYRVAQMALYELIKDDLAEDYEVRTDRLDDGVVTFDRAEGNGHLIRVVGGRHDVTRELKTVVSPKSLKKQDLTDKGRVRYPETIEELRISREGFAPALFTLDDILNKAEEIHNRERAQRQDAYESTYEAEDDGLDAARNIPAHEVLQALSAEQGTDADYGSVDLDDTICCPGHDDNTPSMNLIGQNAVNRSDKLGEEFIGVAACWGECGTPGQPEYFNAIDLAIAVKDCEFSAAIEWLQDTFDVEIDDGGLAPDDDRVDELIETINDGDERSERMEAKEELFDRIADWTTSQQNAVLEELDGGFPRNRGELNNHLETEGGTTEQTELTEQLSRGSRPIEGGGGESDDQLDRLINQETPPQKRLSGIVDGTFFLTVWIQTGGDTKPVVIDSDGNYDFVVKRWPEWIRDLSDDERKAVIKEMTDAEKEKISYQAVEVNEQEVQFKHAVPEQPKSTINRPDNQVLRYIRDQNELPDDEDLYDEVYDFIKACWDHYDEEWLDVVTAHVFHSYLVMPFAYTVYLLFKGQKDTGKTTIQKVLAQLQYNGVFGGNVTPATAQRYAHNYQVALNQDEFEKQSEERRTQLQGLYNTGQRKGGVYPITNTDKGTLADQIQEIFTFSIKTLSANSLYGFDDSFLSRNVVVPTVRTSRKELKNPDKLSEQDLQQLQRLRNQLAAYSVFNWESIMDDVDQVREELQRKGRAADRITLFKGLVQHFKGDDRADKVATHLQDSETLEGVQEINERHRIVLEELVDRFNDTDSKQITVQYKDLAGVVNETLNLEDSEYKASSRSVGKILREYDLIRDQSQKGNDSDCYTTCDLPLDVVIDSLTRYDLTALRDRLVHGEGGSPLSDLGLDPCSVSQLAQLIQSDELDTVGDLLAALLAEAEDDEYEFEELKEAIAPENFQLGRHPANRRYFGMFWDGELDESVEDRHDLERDGDIIRYVSDADADDGNDEANGADEDDDCTQDEDTDGSESEEIGSQQSETREESDGSDETDADNSDAEHNDSSGRPDADASAEQDGSTGDAIEVSDEPRSQRTAKNPINGDYQLTGNREQDAKVIEQLVEAHLDEYDEHGIETSHVFEALQSDGTSETTVRKAINKYLADGNGYEPKPDRLKPLS